MKLHVISDTHTKHRELDLPGGETLIHAGDLMSSGRYLSEIVDFLDWFDGQDYTHKIFIAGNHDRIFEDKPELIERILMEEYPDILYLQDRGVTIDGINFYGSPWTREFCGWAFALHNNYEAGVTWNQIPTDTDVLITHGPAYGMLDQITTPLSPSMDPKHLGCRELAHRIEEIKPKVHICGHIHSANGVLDGAATTHINAACLGEDYNFTNEKEYIEWEL